MGKTSKKQAVKTAKKEANSKNLEFLLVGPRQRNVQNKTTRTSQPRKCSTQLHSESKQLPSKVSTRASTSTAKKCAVLLPRIDMDVDEDDDPHQTSLKINLLRDWDSETDEESEEDSTTKSDVTKTYANRANVGSRSVQSTPNHAGSQRNYGSGDPGPLLTSDSCSSVSDIGETLVDPVTDSPPANISSVTTESESTAPLNHHLSGPATKQLSSSDSNACVCGQQSKIDSLTQQNQLLTAQCKKLTAKEADYELRCLRLTDSLNLKLLGKTQDTVFTEIEEFLDKETLKRFSETAKSDFVFVKLVMHQLWPTGFRDRTVTGRGSNNPHGRTGGKSGHRKEPATKIQLEPEKVSYTEGRLEEHRLYRGDSPSVARIKAKECGRHMARVITYYSKH